MKRPMRMAALVLPLVILGLAIAFLPDRPWGVVVVVRKCVGMLRDIDWADLIDIARPGSSFRLRRLAGSGNPYRTILDPYTAAADRTRGRELFERYCAKCHGPKASGGFGPALVGRQFVHGDTDWALYRTITHGVPGTPMQGGFIERRDVWRVITYLHDLAQALGNGRLDEGALKVATRGAAPEITYEKLLESSSGVGEWMLPGGSYNGQRFSHDAQINVGNVSRLAVQWVHQFTERSAAKEATPIVVGDYMYLTVPPGTVYALDARSGELIWQYTRPIPSDIRVCCLATTRGVAVLGRRVYFGTLDAHLIALDAASGQVLWDSKLEDYTEGYSITSAPLPVGDLVITGIAGGEFSTRCFISAYDAATGALRWRFNTIPQPGEPGIETWGGQSWKTGGGPPWGIGVYDPELGLLYWGVGGAAPDFNAARRPGDNLYTNSMVALNVSTGKLIWHFQFLPGDDHDWDSVQTPSLIDIEESGTAEKLLAVANRGGFFYVLDRRTGRFIRAAPFAKQTWALGLTPSGRPIRAPNSSSSATGNFVYPSVNGATNWWPSAYSPRTNLYYVNVEERGGMFYSRIDEWYRPEPGGYFVGGESTDAYTYATSEMVRAIDPVTATVRWERQNLTVTREPRGGLLATAGGLLFGSDGTRLYALDAANGQQLWQFNTGGQISAPPMTFQMGGKQVIAVLSEQDLFTFTLPP